MNDETKCHTPFCLKDCALVHHDLIKALCIERNRKETSTKYSSKSHVLLRQCVQLYEQNGWDRNSAIQDPLPELRHPLLYLTCAFGKHRVLETLVKLDFDPSVTTKDGANGLHGLVDHFYRVGNMKQCGGFMAIDKRLEVFENVVSTLCLRDPRVFSVKEKINGRTPLHVAAESVLNTSRHARVDGRCDPMKRTRYFQRCLEVMLGHVVELKCNSLLTHSEVMEALAAQDHGGNTILHVLAMSRTLPGWEAIQFVLKNFSDSEFPLIKNKESKTAYEILSSFNEFLAKKLFFPNGGDGVNVTENMRDTTLPLNCNLPQNLEPSISAAVLPRSAMFTKDEHSTAEIAVEAVWSQAGQVDVSPSKGSIQHHNSSIKSLESVVLALHSTAKCTPTSQQTSTGIPVSSTHHNGLPVPSSDAAMFNGKSQDSSRLELTPGERDLNSASVIQNSSASRLPAQVTDALDFSSGGFSNEDPYPVFLPNFPAQKPDKECSEPSPPEAAKREVDVTFSPCCVSPLSQSNVEMESAASASPLTPDSWMPERDGQEAAGSSTAACTTSQIVTNGHSSPHEDLDSTTSDETKNNRGMLENVQKEQAVQESPAASSSENSAFFDFLLTQGSEFNPTMKFQIVELIKSEFGKKMAAFNTGVCQTEAEKRNLEEEIRNSKLALQRKEEEKRRLFAEIDQLQKNIVKATERHKILSEQCVKLKEESEAVKRKISSCEDVEKELFGSPAKMKKLV